MIIIGRNLEQLTVQYSICERLLVDEYSLRLQLGGQYCEPVAGYDKHVVYGMHPDPSELFSEQKAIGQNLSLASHGRVIACSRHRYRIPLDYFGLVQTKGTLARLFVQATCNDGQVEPGFEGFITLEIVNLSPWTIEIPVGSEVAQLYLHKCSSPADRAYHGRYAEPSRTGPTIPIY